MKILDERIEHRIVFARLTVEKVNYNTTMKNKVFFEKSI